MINDENFNIENYNQSKPQNRRLNNNENQLKSFEEVKSKHFNDDYLD